MKTVKVIRHWDLILHKNNNDPKEPLVKKDDNCVLDWEVTGHHHRLDDNADVLVCEPTQANDYYRWVVTVKKPAKLSHEEHNTIELAPWKYSAYVQREYFPLNERKVLD